MPAGPTELSFWQKLATRSQSNLYFALLFLPGDRRDAFRDVYRFLRAADDVADSGLHPAEARRRLAAWRRELAAVYDGRATDPIALRLAQAVRRYDLSRAHFETILDALEEDVAPRRFASREELERWCERMSSTLAYLCLQILGVAPTPGALGYAREMGIALQLANIVRDVDEDATRGHVYLPVDELAAEGLAPEDVLARRYGPGFAAACRRLAARSRALVGSARARLTPAERRPLLVPEIWADVYLALLDELEAMRFDVFARRPYLRRRRKLRIALGTVLASWTGRAFPVRLTRHGGP